VLCKLCKDSRSKYQPKCYMWDDESMRMREGKEVWEGEEGGGGEEGE